MPSTAMQRINQWFRVNFLGAPELKESAVAEIMVQSAGQPAWTEKRYDLMAKEGYQNCTVAYRCIEEIAFSVGSVPWKLYEHKDDGREEVTSHEILDLMERPNPRQAWSLFAHQWAAYLQIGGNSFMEGVGPDTGKKAGTFLEMYNKRPDRIQVIKGAGGPQGYDYIIEGVRTSPPTWKVLPDGTCNIHHWKLFNPLDDWYGMSPISAAGRDIDIHNGYGGWNYKLLKNEARPSGVIRYKMSKTEEQIKSIKGQMKEKHQGWRSKDFGGILVIGDDGQWVQLGFSPKDMEWIQGKQVTSRDICSVFKVPPIILNIGGDMTFANMKEAKLWLWETTITFHLNILRDELNHWLVPRWANSDPRVLSLDYDLDATPLAQVKKDVAWDRQEKAKGIMTINERRSLVNLPDMKGGDILLVSAAEIPLDMVGEEGEEEEAQKFVLTLKEEGYPEKEIKAHLEAAFPGLRNPEVINRVLDHVND